MRPNPPSADQIARYSRACRGMSSVLRERAPEMFVLLCDFIEQHQLDAQRDTYTPAGGEVWTLRLDFEKMERWVQVRAWSASWFDGLEIDIAALAIWNKHQPEDPEHELICWTTKVKRWFGLASDSPPALFMDTLELAFDDARGYVPSDLHPYQIGTEPNIAARPWRA